MGCTWPKKPKMALISEYLAADSSPDASADALAIINIGSGSWKYPRKEGHLDTELSFGFCLLSSINVDPYLDLGGIY